MSTFIKLSVDHAEWSQAQFGFDSERGPQGPIAHMKKEIKELVDEPYDLEEHADMLLLVLDASRRAGFTAIQLLDAANEKLQINKKREWQAPNADGSIEHVRKMPTGRAGDLAWGIK